MIYENIGEYEENDSLLAKNTITDLRFKNTLLEERIQKAKQIYLTSLQECNEKNVKIADIAVDMFNILENNIKN